MSKISIKTKKDFFFGGAKKGKIKMCITKIVNDVEKELFNLTIKDSCVEDYSELEPMFDENGELIRGEEVFKEKVLGQIERQLKFSYKELDELANLISIKKSDFNNETDYLNELFKQGLYLVTIKECQEGLLEKNKGRYQTTAKDWFIV